MHLTVVLDQLTDNLKLVIWSNIKVSLHTFNNRCIKVFRVDLEHDLEREPLQNGKLASKIVRMLIDWQPDLHSIVRILPIDLVEIEAIVHALLHSGDVVVVAHVQPMVQHCLHPALAVYEIEAYLASEKLCHEKVTLPLQVLNNARLHLR